MKVPGDRFYSHGRLWVKTFRDETVIGNHKLCGGTTRQLDCVELAGPGGLLRDAAFAVLGTSKAVTELVAPISGKIVASDTEVEESRQLICENR